MKIIYKTIIVLSLLNYSCKHEEKTENFNSIFDNTWLEIPKLNGPVKSVHLITYAAKKVDSIVVKSNKVWVQSEPEYTFYDKNGKISKIIIRHCLYDEEGYNIGYFYDSTRYKYDSKNNIKLTQSFDTLGNMTFEKQEIFNNGLLEKNSNDLIGSVCNNWRYEYNFKNDTIDEYRYWTGNENVKGNDLDSRKSYLFDSIHRKIEELEFENVSIKHKTTWQYEKNKFILKTDTFFNAQNKAYIVSIEKYDTMSNLINRNYYYQGVMDRPYFYKYNNNDKFGNWQTKLSYVADSVLFELTERDIRYYE